MPHRNNRSRRFNSSDYFTDVLYQAFEIKFRLLAAQHELD